jgi:hypothetical protein
MAAGVRGAAEGGLSVGTKKAWPQADGSVIVEDPDRDIRFQMGNRKTFAEFDAAGGARGLQLTDCAWAGSWSVALREGQSPVVFSRAKGLGRLWELEGKAGRLDARCLSFLGEAEPGFRQRWALENPSGEEATATLAFDFDFRCRLNGTRRLRNALSRLVPRRPSLAKPWAYLFLFDAPRPSLRPIEGGFDVPGTVPLAFRANREFHITRKFGRRATILFRVHVAAGGAETLDIVLASAAQSTQDGIGGTAAAAEGGAAGLLEQAADGALADARAYAAWLSGCSEGEEPLLASLGAACLNAAVSCYKDFPGGFSGFLAGLYYAAPPRLYFRDGYWTAQALLSLRPDLVRRHILSLARGVHGDGSVPSAVFSPHLFSRFGLGPEARIDWLSDHYDGPSFFVLLVSDYLKASGDGDILAEEISGEQPRRSLAEDLALTLGYLLSLDRDGDGLIEKPYKANDWADNVKRSAWVTYDQALYAAALRDGASILRSPQAKAKVADAEKLAERCGEAFEKAVAGLDRELWDEASGHYVDYKRPGFTEGHLAIDSLLVPYLGLCGREKRSRVLEAAKALQTRANPGQGYGDWGVMCAWPCYSRRKDLFHKSADRLRYHNGSDWPYLDGIYATVLAETGDPDWRYALSRWWEYGLERGWLTPVEFFSPAWPAGGFLQGWSGFPAAVLARIREMPIGRQ